MDEVQGGGAVTAGRWRPAACARSLDDVLARVRLLDPAARLVDGSGDGRARPRGWVDGVSIGSATVVPGDLFAALPGARHHGGAFAAAAARAGAVAALADRPCPPLTTLVVADPRAVLGPLTAWLLGDPGSEVAVHGVTGTNGKTSVTHLLAAGLTAAGHGCALGGTLGQVTPRRRRTAARTTPEAPELQELVAAARDDGASDLALEVSSHGLALHRTTGLRCRTAVFTNLSADHLELHGDLEGYFATKASLFTPEHAEVAVVGVDDEWGRRLAATTRCELVTFSAHGHPADWRADRVRPGRVGTTFRLRGPGVDREVALGLLGPHQADNALAAVAALAVAGVDLDAAVAGVEGVDHLPGRLEPVDVGQPFAVYVDFAHNSGAHRRLLPFLRELCREGSGRLLVVLGITGERDPGKRAELGDCAARLADVVVVTDESPHSEEPALLRAALADAARATAGAEVVVEPDRRRALERAVAAAGPGDVVVVVGRGADDVLVSGAERTPFDDRETLRAVLGAHLAAASRAG